MLDFRMRQQRFRHRQNIRDARFIVRPEQRIAVGNDQILACISHHIREIADLQRNLVVQRDVLAVVLGNDPRIHAFAAEIRRGVHVRDKADGRHLIVQIRRDSAVQIALILPNLLDAQLFHFFFQYL